MKKILFVLVAVVGLTASAQNDNNSSALSKNSWVVEINTGSYAIGSTAFSLISVDGSTFYSVGAEAGYFIADDLALKAGLGYGGGDDSDGVFSYKLGAKYYVIGEFPIGVDFTGNTANGDSTNWVGLQGGYAWFVANNVSIEPTLRYNVAIDKEAASVFQGLIGFAFHF
ncbi:hypothetical protein [Flagellimonas onchidii]|uniref:hypothetical protein n=1 Tax=Flagellimonas onchidii TaxID=2562684 RepID=UPI0010A5AB91|nr:hypothetical protein [Allomuricauda onchidii]